MFAGEGEDQSCFSLGNNSRAPSETSVGSPYVRRPRLLPDPLPNRQLNALLYKASAFDGST